jgi:hypothetical protein
MDLKIAKTKHRTPPIQSQYSMLSLKSMHCWNPLFKGFVLSHSERVGCVGHHGVLESMCTVEISPIFCRVPHIYPPKMIEVNCNPNMHAELEVNALLESPIQGLHFESL